MRFVKDAKENPRTKESWNESQMDDRLITPDGNDLEIFNNKEEHRGLASWACGAFRINI